MNHRPSDTPSGRRDDVAERFKEFEKLYGSDVPSWKEQWIEYEQHGKKSDETPASTAKTIHRKPARLIN